MRPSVDQRLASWAAARAERLRVWRQMTALRCEYAQRSSFWDGDDGVPRCYRGGGATPDWCEPCQQRDEIWRGQYWLVRKIEREQFYALCRLVDRSSAPSAAPEAQG